MKAIVNDSYGAPEVLKIEALPLPAVGPQDIRVRVYASPIHQGDRRIRASDFPGLTWPVGRLLMGITKPNERVPGTDFSGRVEAVGAAVTRFSVGDAVYGGCDGGAHAEHLVIPQDGAVALRPEGLSHVEAAALPYGANTALHFVRDIAKLKRGERALIVGGSGGVGRFAVQLARHLGAEVTAVCSARNEALVRALGAQHVIDYHTQDFTQSGERYDLIFDTTGATTVGRCQGSLTPTGRHASLEISASVVWGMLLNSVRSRRTLFDVATSSQAGLEDIAELVKLGALKPSIDRVFPMDEVVAAHHRVEARVAAGSVVLSLGEDPVQEQTAAGRRAGLRVAG